MTLTIEVEPGKYAQTDFFSKLYSHELHEDYGGHKNSFTPADVRAVLEATLTHGKLPEGFDLPQWRVALALPPPVKEVDGGVFTDESLKVLADFFDHEPKTKDHR